MTESARKHANVRWSVYACVVEEHARMIMLLCIVARKSSSPVHHDSLMCDMTHSRTRASVPESHSCIHSPSGCVCIRVYVLAGACAREHIRICVYV